VTIRTGLILELTFIADRATDLAAAAFTPGEGRDQAGVVVGV
jgi:hypothetical protein